MSQNLKTIILIEKFQLTNIGARVLGVKLKAEVMEAIHENEDLAVNFDFNGVKSMSTGFAKELFGELYRDLGDDFLRRIKITLPKDDDVIKSLIIKGIATVKDSM